MPLVQFIGFGRFFRGEGDSFIRRYLYINDKYSNSFQLQGSESELTN